MEKMTDSLDSGGSIAECESKISSIDAQIAKLQSLRAIERNKLGKLKYHSTPLHVLPLEMLSEIFKFFVVAADNDLADNEIVVVPHAALLSEVCHYWRQVALGLPSLWSELTIGVVERPEEKHIQGIRAWLARSSPLPLSIYLFWDLEDHIESESAVINEIVGVKSRLKSLRIGGMVGNGRQPPTMAIGALMGDPLPALQTLRLDDSIELEWAADAADARIDLSAVAPHLRTVVFPEDYLNLFDNVPWPQFKDLKFFTAIDDTFDILRQSRNIEQLEIRTIQWGYGEDTSLAYGQPTLALPVLRHFSLELEFSTTDIIGEILPLFHCLACPALTSFRMHFELDSEALWNHQEFALFQSRSPHIQHLELSNAMLDSADLTSMLRFSPALKSLILASCNECIDDAFLQALEYRESDADAEPHAARLEVLSWIGLRHKFHDSVLEGMLRSRCLTVTPPSKIARLKKVHIDCGGGHVMVDAAFAAQMEACIEEFVIL
ncbi:hypothetical protein C8F04DRAFT_1132179 [Mycena alexandri]|uniref:F-box domain-containing protein n=1 Tax=Mycena alexandri TaxID=1745969 RepID=A0AAD6SBS8_9AGAR|nr:hypothetical protein C8F04DRAFT_1132179 [Mycena alexandri]